MCVLKLIVPRRDQYFKKIHLFIYLYITLRRGDEQEKYPNLRENISRNMNTISKLKQEKYNLWIIMSKSRDSFNLVVLVKEYADFTSVEV